MLHMRSISDNRREGGQRPQVDGECFRHSAVASARRRIRDRFVLGFDTNFITVFTVGVCPTNLSHCGVVEI